MTDQKWKCTTADECGAFVHTALFMRVLSVFLCCFIKTPAERNLERTQSERAGVGLRWVSPSHLNEASCLSQTCSGSHLGFLEARMLSDIHTVVLV